MGDGGGLVGEFGVGGGSRGDLSYTRTKNVGILLGRNLNFFLNAGSNFCISFFPLFFEDKFSYQLEEKRVLFRASLELIENYNTSAAAGRFSLTVCPKQ